MGEWNQAPSGINCRKKLALLEGEGVFFDAEGMLKDKSAVLWDEFEVAEK